MPHGICQQKTGIRTKNSLSHISRVRSISINVSFGRRIKIGPRLLVETYIFLIFLFALKGSKRFDIDGEGLCDRASPFPHMLPRTPADFEAAVQALGVKQFKPLVVYSSSGFVGAARAWWMFRTYGKLDVGILNGGFAQWVSENRPTASGEATNNDPAEVEADGGPFKAAFNSNLLKEMPQILDHVKNSDAKLLDARSEGRFLGTRPEPRPGLLSGHMPGSISIPYRHCIDENTGKLKSKSELEELFKSRNAIRPGDTRQIVLTCGTGVTAAILALSLHELGFKDAAVYDGSWSEYGSYQSNPCAR